MKNFIDFDFDIVWIKYVVKNRILIHKFKNVV